MKLASLKKNAIHNVVGWVVPSAIFFVLTPIMVRHLGVSGFGIITLVQMVAGYMTVLNFGFSEAITKQIAENYEKNREEATRTMWVGLALFAAVGLAGAIIINALAGVLGNSILKVPAELRASTVTSLRIGGGIFLLNMLGEFYRGTAMGCNRFDIPNVTRIIRVGASGIFIVVTLVMGGGLVAVMLATLAGLIVGTIWNLVWMHRVLPMRWISGDYKRIFSDVFHFSKHVFFVRIAGLISGEVCQFCLAALRSTASVAFYEVPTRVAETGSGVLNRILQVFYPAFSSMDRVREKDKIRSVTFSVLSIQLVIITPFMLMVMLEGPRILSLWINSDFGRGAAPIINLIAVTYFLSSLTNLPMFVAMSFGFPNLLSKYSLIRMAITIALVYPMVQWYGLTGAVWVLFLSGLPGIAFIYETIVRAFEVNPFTALAKPLLIHAAISGSFYVLYEYVFRNSALYTPLGVLAVGALYPVITVALGATSHDDTRRLRSLVTVWR